MPLPTSVARAALDSYIQQLAELGDGLTLDDFRSEKIAQAQRVARFVRKSLLWTSALFMVLALGVLAAQTVLPKDRDPSYDLISASVWALGLGGLGAVSSIFLHVLRLLPEDTLRTSDEFEIVGRLVLGCLFSTIIAITVAATPMTTFFQSLHSIQSDGKIHVEGGVQLLLPFLAGYSLPLVLRILEKAIRAVELTIGTDDPRVIRTDQRRPATQRRSTRRSNT
jgi:hypothetical protein